MADGEASDMVTAAMAGVTTGDQTHTTAIGVTLTTTVAEVTMVTTTEVTTMATDVLLPEEVILQDMRQEPTVEELPVMQAVDLLIADRV